MKHTTLTKTILSLCAGLGFTVAAQSAFAASDTCTLNNINFGESGTVNRELGFYCAEGKNYYGWTYVRGSTNAQNSSSYCTSRSLDSVKSWLSIAQAALLSGKTLTVYYDTCIDSNGNRLNQIASAMINR